MRVYLDKQILSHLYNKEKVEYIQLLDKLYNCKNHLLFCYSHAHLLDLKNDTTNIKYKELEFMETLVDNNYLSHDAIKKETTCYLAHPQEAFDDIEENNYEKIDFSSIFDFEDDFLTEEEKQNLNYAKDLLENLKFDFNFLNTTEIPENFQSLFNSVLPSRKNSMSIQEMYDSFYQVINNIKNDKSIYKDLRSNIDKSFNDGKYTIDYNNISFNDDLKNSELKKTFIQFVKDSLVEKDENKISRYDFFTLAYCSLDLLGISKEPSKKVKFNNVMNDAIHSYYGAYCDIVVSDDDGFLKKTRALYKLLNIHTEVLHSSDFIKTYSFTIENRENNYRNFTDLLSNDIKNGLIIKSTPSLRFNRTTSTIKPKHNYFGYFNRIDNAIENGIQYLYFYKEISNYSNFMFYKEFESIINNAVRIFGVDTNMKGDFDWNKEVKEISTGLWKGRRWQYDDFSILIEINEGTKTIGMLFNFDPNQQT